MVDIAKLVKVVRSDPYLGKHSCSYIDETTTDKELTGLVRATVRGLLAEGREANSSNVLAELTRMENVMRENDDPKVFPQIDRTPGWEQKIQVDLGRRRNVTVSQQEYEEFPPWKH